MSSTDGSREQLQPNLLDRARRNDSAALETLLVRSKQLLQRLAHVRLGDDLRHRVRSSDVLQSTYLQVFKSLPSFSGSTEEDFVNWVVRILENTIRDRARYYRTLKRELYREADDDVRTLDPADPSSRPSTVAVLGEQLAQIGRAMGHLSKDHVRILTLHMDPEQTHRRTAQLLGRSEGASRVLLARARAALLMELTKAREGEGT